MNDLGRRALTWRRLGVLIRQLPRESATKRAMLGPGAEWGWPEHLLAAIFDAVQQGNWQRGGGNKARRPRALPRPGRDEPGRKRLGGKKSYTLPELQHRLANWDRKKRDAPT